jgi:recombination protein RecR
VRDDPLGNLIKLLARLPGIGEKSGSRLAHFILNSPDRYTQELSFAITEVKERIKKCGVCGYPDVTDPCSICDNEERDRQTVLVVELPQDLEAIEKTGVYKGLYHVLSGTISPLSGRGPEDLTISLLMNRIKGSDMNEVILGTNPSVEGDATASYLEELISNSSSNVSITRPARGIPVGSEIKYLDAQSLTQALQCRRKEECSSS